MDKPTKISIYVGDFEFEVEGAQIEVEERFSHFKQEGLWNAMLERIQETKDYMDDYASTLSKVEGLTPRGSNFRALLDNYSLDGKPEQVLGALHYLRDIEKSDDCPPRIINTLFEDANIEPPGNLSLYINRLKEKKFLVIPKKHGEKNRYAQLTKEGRLHLEEKSTNK